MNSRSRKSDFINKNFTIDNNKTRVIRQLWVRNGLNHIGYMGSETCFSGITRVVSHGGHFSGYIKDGTFYEDKK